jgi:hypothetical protein
VRRFAAAAALAAALVPGALMLGFGVSRVEAVRCAMACGHDLPADGAACCPTNAGAAAFKTCPGGDAAIVPAGLPPTLFSPVTRLAPPAESDPFELPASPARAGSFASGIDHVPLLLS